MNNEIIDCEKLTDKELLNEFANRVIAYNRLKDEELNIIEDHPNRDVWDDEMKNEYRNLIIEIDDAWVRVRECIRIIKKDESFWA